MQLVTHNHYKNILVHSVKEYEKLMSTGGWISVATERMTIRNRHQLVVTISDLELKEDELWLITPKLWPLLFLLRLNLDPQSRAYVFRWIKETAP